VIYVFGFRPKRQNTKPEQGLLGDLISQATVTFFEAILRIGVG
jgi:hypothetical protein